MSLFTLAVFFQTIFPGPAAAGDTGSSRPGSSYSEARSLADAPSLMEKARKRAQIPTPVLKRKAPNAKSAFGLLRWAARLTGRELPAGIRAPALVALPIHRLRQRVCPQEPTDCASLVAAYGIQDQVILHSDKINMDDPIDRSYLLHELVHFLQHLDEGEHVNRDCESILRWERHAYVAQSRYLAKAGLPFPIDEMMKLTYCSS